MSDFNDHVGAWHDRDRINPQDLAVWARELRRVYDHVWPYYQGTLTPETNEAIIAGCQQAWQVNSAVALPLYRAQIIVARVYEKLGVWQDGYPPEEDDIALLCHFFDIIPGVKMGMTTEDRILLAQWNRDQAFAGIELSVPPEDPAVLEAWLALPADNSAA